MSVGMTTVTTITTNLNKNALILYCEIMRKFEQNDDNKGLIGVFFCQKKMHSLTLLQKNSKHTSNRRQQHRLKKKTFTKKQTLVFPSPFATIFCGKHCLFRSTVM